MPSRFTTMTIAAMAAALPGLAAGATLTFDGAICGGLVCTFNQFIDQGTGSLPGLSVIYDRNLTTAAADPLIFYDDDFSDLTNVAVGATPFGSPGAGISFVPTAGGAAQVTGFSLGAWPMTDRTAEWSVIDLFDGSILAASPEITVDGKAHTRVTGLWTSVGGVQIRFGPNTFLVGIDDIDYALVAAPVPVVPLPAGLPLLAGGLAALALLRWARRS